MNTELDNECSDDGTFISKPQLVEWQVFIENKLGFVLPQRQQHWLQQAIVNVAQTQGLSLEQLRQRVKQDSKLRQQLFDAVLIPETRFFRHSDSLRFIGEQAIQAKPDTRLVEDISFNLLNKKSPVDEGAYKVWSVGCSRGQEVWSLAMVLDDLSCPFSIVGSDVSQQVLQHAKEATYSLRELSDIPKRYHRYAQIQHQEFEISKQLHDKAAFVHHNLFADSGLFVSLDAIICQNVLIYFRQFDQRDILARLVKQLAKGGYLLLAPGEAIYWQHPKMRRVENSLVNAWQKVN